MSFIKVIFFMHEFRFKALVAVTSFSEKQSDVHWKRSSEETNIYFFPISTDLSVFTVSNAFIYTQFVLEKDR